MNHCIHCGCFIEPSFGAVPPADHADHSGAKDDPRAPGDYDNICGECNYGLGLRGGDNASPTYKGDFSEWE